LYGHIPLPSFPIVSYITFSYPKLCSFLNNSYIQTGFVHRAIYEAGLATKPELAYITEAIGHNSDLQVQTAYMVRLLMNESKIKTCRDHEEDEGHINTDMLNRLIIVGGPLIQPGPGIQDQLIKQVFTSHYVHLTSRRLSSINT
jgi:hypothetical protein